MLQSWIKRVSVGAVLALGLMLAAGAASGAQCGFERCWGALGFGPSGEWSWSKGYVAEAGAIAKVRNQCPECTEVETFYNGCAVVARTPEGAWGFGWGETRASAQARAVSYCTRFGKGCEPLVWACSF